MFCLPHRHTENDAENAEIEQSEGDLMQTYDTAG